MKQTFWLLDLNHEAYEGKSSIWLWGITHEGKRVLIVDDNYRAYFYLLPRKDQDPEELRKNLEAEKPHPSVESSTIEKKKLLAEERVVLRVFCKDPEFLERAARDTLKKTGAEATYEEKLRLAIKYQYDYGIKPCQWYEVDTAASSIDPREFSVQETLIAREHPRAIAKEEPPELDLFSFSLLSVSKTGAPSPTRDPIQIITWRTNKNTDDILTRADSDQETIQKFGGDVSKINPDFILSFEGNSIDWPYLVKRANKTKTLLRVGRDGGPPHQSLYGHYSLIGRANVDLLNFADDLYDVKIKTVENVAKYLEIQLSEEKPIGETAYFDYWSKPDQRKILVKHVEEQSETILKIGQEAIDYVIQISALSGLPPDQVIAAAVGFRVDNYLIMETHNLGQLIPARTEQPIIPYKGAIVLEPKVGLHDGVASLDFSSMYPSIMIKYNISPDTLVTGKEKADDLFEVPEVKHRFRKSPSGFYRIVLSKLIEARKATKTELKRTTRSDPRYPLLKAREKAVKVMTNAVYGYAGWAGARWYSKEVAESAAALGRETINRAISLAKSLGLTVFYGDTDSVFVNYDEKLVQKFQAEIDHELGLEINLSEVYKRILFTEAKKKYGGLRTDGEIDVVGLEAVRGDWSNLAREVQNTVLRMVLEDANPSRATAYVQDLTSNLKSKKIPLSSFIIWKTLTKPVGAYEVNAPHVEVAKKMAKDGWPVTAGDKVGFVITKRPGKLFQKAEPHYKETVDDVDYDYYVRNQIVPAAARILAILGVSEDKLLAPASQVSLSVGTKRG